MAMKKKIKELAASGLVATNDPVELHILYQFEKLMHQNTRLKNYVQKSGAWAELKEIPKWKPFDFLQYFCNLYHEKYKKSYRISGNIVRAYQKIELFLRLNKIPNEEFKEFIDTAFTRHFSDSDSPVLGSICSATLYNHLMTRRVKHIKSDDWFKLDQTIQEESEDFEKYVEDEDDFDLDEKLALENEKIKRLRELEED
jgi:hypothetical protein